MDVTTVAPQVTQSFLNTETTALAAAGILAMIGFWFGWMKDKQLSKVYDEWRADTAAQAKLLEDQRDHHKEQVRVMHEGQIALIKQLQESTDVLRKCAGYMRQVNGEA